MYNIRILARNLAEESGAVIAASPAMEALLDESILQRATQRGIAAHTTSLAAQRLILDLAASSRVNMVAFTRTNLTTSATLRTRVQNAIGSPSTTLYDTTALTAFALPSDLDTVVDVYTEPGFAGLRNTVQYFTEQANAGSIICDIADSGNPDGYMSLTHMWAGRAYTLRYDPPFGGVDMSHLTGSTASRADDGTHVVDTRWTARKIMLRLDFIDDTDLPVLLAAARYLGRNRECFLDVYPELGNTKALYHRGAFRLVDSPTFNPHQVGLHKNTMTFEET